jgi:hypothetical protein
MWVKFTRKPDRVPGIVTGGYHFKKRIARQDGIPGFPDEFVVFGNQYSDPLHILILGVLKINNGIISRREKINYQTL